MSKELSELITEIGECRSKQQEDKIMKEEQTKLKQLITKPKTNPKLRREYLIRSIYLEMLGHDASFAYLFAVNLTQDKNILNKRVGYLACALLLNSDSEFYILLVASLQKDLQSDNWLEVYIALGAIAHYSNSLIIQAVSEPVIKLMDHKNAQIRKKVAMVLYKFYQVDKNSVPDIEHKMKKLLCDYDPAVMGATLPYYKELSKENPEKIKNLIGPLVVILKQVIENKLPKEFIYHKFQGPWIQITILEILGNLGKDDLQNSELIYEVLNICLKNAENAKNNIGYATVYQCVKTICNIYPNDKLTQIAGETISRFLKSESPNLRCTGIIGLGLIIQINPKYVMNFQNIIVDCMEVNDETLKKYTFNLLYKMTSVKNVEIIVEKMIKYLQDLKKIEKSDYNIEVLKKIMELIERFAPRKDWFVKTTNDLFINFGEMIDDEIITKLYEILYDWEKESESIEEFKKLTIENYATIVENYSTIPSSFVKLMSLIIGEYANKLYENDEEKIKGIIEMMVYLLNKKYEDEMTKCFLINAIMKVHSGINYLELSFVDEAIDKYSKIKNPDIQQRCLEYKRNKAKKVSQGFYNFNSNNKSSKNEIDFELKYLDEFCKANNKQYNTELSDYYTDKFTNPDKKMNIGPYQISSNILSMPGSSSKMNNLYDSNENYLTSDMKNELNVKAEKKWGEEGYKKNEDSNDNKWGIDTIKIQSIEGDNQDVKKDFYSDNNKKNKKTKKQIEEEDPNKKKLMLDLFGGMNGDAQPEKKISKNKPEPKKEPIKNNKINLFEGLTQNNSNNNSNISINQSKNNYEHPNKAFTPYNINTDKFGELWENFPDEVEFNLLCKVNTPEKYHEIIKTQGNFAPVDIINNEAISAAYYKNQIVLVHATVDNNQIFFLVKCQNNSFNNEVIDFIKKLFTN